MKRLLLTCLILFQLSAVWSQHRSIRSTTLLDSLSQMLMATSDSIWQYSESSFRERSSISLIKGKLVAAGFQLEEDLLGIPSLFIAQYGNGGPVIGILAEADADSPLKQIDGLNLPQAEMGHGAGHHLLASGSLGAALTLKDLIESGQIEATIRYYYSTAEGSLGTRAFLAREGYFDDADLVFFWHPSPVTSARLSQWDAIIDLDISFFDDPPAAMNHASALTQYLDSLRGTTDSTLLLVSKIQHANFNLAVTRDTLRMRVRVEHPFQSRAEEVYEAIQTKLESWENAKLTWRVFRAVKEFVPNRVGNEMVHQLMTGLAVRKVLDSDDHRARQLYQIAGKKEGRWLSKPLPFSEGTPGRRYGYGSDIGDVSWKAPMISFVVSCFPTGLSMSNWEATAFGRADYAKAGMMQAAQLITDATIEYLSSEPLREAIHNEWKQRISGKEYTILMQGPPDSTEVRKRSH